MKYKIVVDSSSDLLNDYLTDEEIGFEVAPLSINVNSQTFIDDKDLDTNKLLEAVDEYKGKSTSSCPAPGDFEKAFAGADYVFCVTISTKLSGSFNSAYSARMNLKRENSIHLIDSKLTAGALILIVDELVRLIKSGLEYEEICQKIDEFADSRELLFVLNKFDNLVKNGRMSKLAYIFASALFIKPLCTGENGEIKIVAKPRTKKVALAKLVEFIGKKCHSFIDKVCIISHCQAEDEAIALKEEIGKNYAFKEIRVIPMRGLCSFYASSKGIIVCF